MTTVKLLTIAVMGSASSKHHPGRSTKLAILYINTGVSSSVCMLCCQMFNTRNRSRSLIVAIENYSKSVCLFKVHIAVTAKLGSTHDIEGIIVPVRGSQRGTDKLLPS